MTRRSLVAAGLRLAVWSGGRCHRRL